MLHAVKKIHMYVLLLLRPYLYLSIELKGLYVKYEKYGLYSSGDASGGDEWVKWMFNDIRRLALISPLSH